MLGSLAFKANVFNCGLESKSIQLFLKTATKYLQSRDQDLLTATIKRANKQQKHSKNDNHI
jgi:hypothetical protein